MQAKQKLHKDKTLRDEIGNKNVIECMSREDVDGLSALPHLWRNHILPKDSAPTLAARLRAEQDSLLCGCKVNEQRFQQLIKGEARKFFTDRIEMYKHGLESSESRQQVRRLLRHFDNMFINAYETIFDTQLNIGDTDALHAWTVFAEQKDEALAEMSCKQKTDDLVQCYLHARHVQPMYMAIFEAIAKDTGTKFTPAPMKTVFRALEKCAFRERVESRFHTDCICDVIRGAIECSSLIQVLDVAKAIFQHPDFVVCRLKDRFTHPTSAGWRDVMLNGYFKNDPNKHIVEVQLHHTQMLIIRANFGGHYVYARFRFVF